MKSPRDANPWLIAAVISMATFMEVLDTSIANVSLTHIAGGLAAGLDESTWVLTTYLVANAVMMPISGWLSTFFGTKRFFMTCVALFTISSLLCGMAPTLDWLIIFRLMQGIGGAGMAPVVQAMLADLFPPAQRGMAFSIYGLSVVFAPAIGPTLGGWITDNYSWRWIFLINVPVGIVSLILTALLVREAAAARQERERLRREGATIDWLGFGLSVVGIGCLEFVLDRGEREDWFSSPWITSMALVSVLSLVGLVLWELGRRNPMVDIPLFRTPNFLASFLAMFSLGFVLFGTTALLPQFLEQLLGYTAQRAGMALTAGGIFLVVMMPIVGGVLVPRVPARTLIIIGLFIQAAALWHMAGFTLGISFEQAVLARVFQVAGVALIFAPLTRNAYEDLPTGKNNNASALINLARNLGGSVGIAVSNTILTQRTQFHQSRLVEHISAYDPQTQSTLSQIGNVIGGAANSTQTALGYVYRELVRQATMLSYVDVLSIMTIGTLCVIPVAFLLKKGRTQSGGQAPAH